MSRTAKPNPLFTDQDLSTSFTLPADQGLKVAAFRAFSIHLRWTGTPVGNYQFQVSHDGIDYIDRGAPVAAGGGAGDFLFEEGNAYFNFVRIDYVSASGAGSGTASLLGIDN